MSLTSMFDLDQVITSYHTYMIFVGWLVQKCPLKYMNVFFFLSQHSNKVWLCRCSVRAQQSVYTFVTSHFDTKNECATGSTLYVKGAE